jgi:hypothetical protein
MPSFQEKVHSNYRGQFKSCLNASLGKLALYRSFPSCYEFYAMNSVTSNDLSRLLGASESDLPASCLDLFLRSNWQYEFINGEALDTLVSELLDRIRRKEFSIVVPGDKSRWVRGWGENLDQFIASEGKLDSLAPKYVRPNMPVRLFRRLVQPVEPNFEQNWRRVYQEWLFQTYFTDAKQIFEFGCGSGIHVSVLADMFPDKKIVGLDWAEPSCEIVNNMHKLRGWNTEGRLFDFYHPNYDLEIPPDSTVMTFAALEQISDASSPFIEFLIKKRPKLCVFIEPIYDWYDAANFIDHLAMRSHETRNFLKGMYGNLRQLQKDGRIEILKEHRVEFGSLLHEGYSQIIWRPV